VTDESVITHHASRRTNHRSFLKFRGNFEIPRQRANSAARRKTVGPTYHSYTTMMKFFFE